MDSFNHFDNTVEERRNKFGTELESILETLLAQDKDLKRIRKKTKKEEEFGRMVSGTQSVLGNLIGRRAVMRGTIEELDHLMSKEDELKTKALDQAMKIYFRETAEELVNCGKDYITNNGLKSQCSIEVYNRLRKEFVELTEIDLGNCTYLDKLISEAPTLREFIDIDVFTQSDEQMEIVKRSLSAVQKAGYITKRNYGHLIDYLSPEKVKKKRVKTAVQPVIIKTKPIVEEAPVIEEPKKDLEKITAEDRENSIFFLTDMLKLERETAQDYAHRMSTDDLILVYSQLAEVVGDECSQGIIKSNPELFDYLSNRTFNKYLKVLKTICNGDDPNEVLCKHPTSRYSNLESALELKEELKPGTEINGDDNLIVDNPKTLEEVKIHRYMFIHRNNQDVVKRVNDLIEEGETYVEEHEHWGGASKGARGANILINIKYQMKCLFSELGLEEPSCKINFGERKLYISSEDQQELSKIVDDYKRILEE